MTTEQLYLGQPQLVMVPCDCRAAMRVRYWGIPKSALDWTFDTFPASLGTKIKVGEKLITLDGVRTAFVERDKWIILMGPIGTGKTSIAISGYKLLRDAGVEGRYWNVTELLNAEKRTWGNPDLASSLEALHSGPGLLVLDGLGETGLVKGDPDRISQLIGQRYVRQLRTIITSNWDKKDFDEQLGAWVYDRLKDIAIVFNVTGKSMRGKV